MKSEVGDFFELRYFSEKVQLPKDVPLIAQKKLPTISRKDRNKWCKVILVINNRYC